VTRTQNNPLRWVLAAGAAILLLLVGAGSARAASYPAGSGAFSGGLEGWAASGTECNVSLLGLCKTSVTYDGAKGDPPGSVEQQTETLVGALGLFSGKATIESPSFQAVQGGAGTVKVDRAYEPGGLAKLGPSLTYKVLLVDKTSGSTAKAIEQTVSAESPFTTASGGVTLVEGHSYALRIESETSALLELPLPLLANTYVQFDNVSLTGPGENGGGTPTNGNNGGSGGNGSNGASGLTNSQLASLLQSSLIGPATLSGSKLSVKAKCPAKVGVPCKVTLRGMLSRKKPATGTRSAKVAKGKIKKFVLKVKPAAKSKLMTKKKLLFKETVKAGAAKATVYKTLKLVRR
jgi:hypothetical protein